MLNDPFCIFQKILLKMDLKVKILSESVREYYTDYKPAYETDSGINLVIPEDVLVKARTNDYSGHGTPHYTAAPFPSAGSFGLTFAVTKIKLGIACEPVTHDKKPHGYTIKHRSSVSDCPIRLANFEGLIDFHYRGELIAKVINLSTADYVLKKGTMLFQVCSYDLSPMKLTVVTELTETARGAKGFGSTGIQAGTANATNTDQKA